MTALKVAICGSGHRSRTVWQRHLREVEGFALVGVQDVHRPSLQRAVDEAGLAPELAFDDLKQMIEATRPDAVVVCPIHAAHAAAVRIALAAGCHVLVEKPFTTDLGDAVQIVRQAEELGLLVGIVQNWRTKSAGVALKRAVRDGAIGAVSHIFFRYVRDRELPHLPEYLFAEPDPMLYALTVHHVDLFRYVLGDDIARVEGHLHRPSWSRYEHPSVLQAWLETERGVAISYAATLSSRNGGLLAWENLVVEGELGTIVNDTNTFDPPLMLSRRGESPMDLTADVSVRDPIEQYVLADTTILHNFREAILRGAPLISPAAENLGTVAALEGLRQALHERRAVDVSELRQAAGGQ